MHEFDTPTDHDWYKFEAVEGSTYIIQTFNSQPFNTDYALAMDPYIYLYNSGILTDPSMEELASDDDSGDMPDVDDDDWEARIVFNCAESGTYYIILRHYDSEYGITGTYEISVVSPI